MIKFHFFGCLLTSHFHPNVDGYCTHPKVDDYCSFLYIVRNLCNNHPKLDVSYLPKLVGTFVDIQNWMFLVFQIEWHLLMGQCTGNYSVSYSTDHGSLGFSAQQYHPKTTLTFPIQQFGSIRKYLQINPKPYQQVVIKFDFFI